MWEIWADDVFSGAGFAKKVTIQQVTGTIAIDAFVALLVWQIRNDIGPQSTVELRAAQTGIVLWRVGP